MGSKATGAYDRTRVLAAAREATVRRRWKTAIRQYRRILAAEPDNVEIHAALAPLLARTRQPFDAWLSFKAVARHERQRSGTERACAVYARAGRDCAENPAVWTEWAELLRRDDRCEEALDVLLNGARALGKRRHRPEAIYLLRLARRVDPWRPQIVLALCRLLRRSSQRDEALRLAAELPSRVRGSERLEVLRAIFLDRPTLRGCGAWLSERFGMRPRTSGATR